MVNSIVFDGAARVVLPTTAAVKGPPTIPAAFAAARAEQQAATTAAYFVDIVEVKPAPPIFSEVQWDTSRLAREILDEINLPMAPRPEPAFDPAESIIMSGNEIVNSLRTGGHAVTQRRTVYFETLPELSIAEAPAFERAPSIQAEAATALAALERPRKSRSIPRAAPTPPKATQAVWVAAAIVIGGLAIAVLAAVAKGSL